MIRSELTSGAQETLWAEEDTPLTSRRVDRTKGIDQPAREPFHPPATPSETFAKIRNFLAGRHVGATRDSALPHPVLLCLFSQLYLNQPARTPFHPPATPSAPLARIRNSLAGRPVGATRDSALLDQGLLCLFAKLYLNQIGVNGSARALSRVAPT